MRGLWESGERGVADWVFKALTPVHQQVAGLVPALYADYVRILHPATDEQGDPLRWTDIGRMTGREVQALGRFADVASGAGDGQSRLPTGIGDFPRRGTLDLKQLQVLVSLLEGASDFTAPCSALYWEGWSVLPEELRRGGNLVVQGGRSYRHIQSSVQRMQELSQWVGNPGHRDTRREVANHNGLSHLYGLQTPNQWWPEDRSWFVATEVDQDSTLVGGSKELIASVLDTALLESFAVDPGEYIT